jgi:hypothetical protein
VSIQTLLHVLNNSKAKKSHRLVLIEIANHVNEKSGLAWPSQTTIALKTGLTRRWVNEVIADLVAVGELKIIPEGGPNGEHAYSIPGCELTSHPPRRGCELSSKKGVNSLLTESYMDESISENSQNLKKHLTPEEAVKLGLTPGSTVYRIVTGEAEAEAEE